MPLDREGDKRAWFEGDIVIVYFPNDPDDIRVGTIVAEPDELDIMGVQLYSMKGEPTPWRTAVYSNWCTYVGNINVC